jgi:hypothetical protein
MDGPVFGSSPNLFSAANNGEVCADGASLAAGPRGIAGMLEAGQLPKGESDMGEDPPP